MASSFVPFGSVPPSRFVSLVVGQNRNVQLSSSGDQTVIGISGEWTHLPPLLNLDDGDTAIAGGSITVYDEPGKEAWLELGGTVAVGDFVKPDGSNTGKGITAGSDGDFYAAKAVWGGVSGDLVKVILMFGFRGA